MYIFPQAVSFKKSSRGLARSMWLKNIKITVIIVIVVIVSLPQRKGMLRCGKVDIVGKYEIDYHNCKTLRPGKVDIVGKYEIDYHNCKKLRPSSVYLV